jgi:hypothetical protein
VTDFAIRWPTRNGTVGPTPFAHTGEGRPLGITFHSESFRDMPASEAPALDLLRELAQRRGITAVDTQPGHFSHMEIETRPGDDYYFPVSVTSKDGELLLRGGVGIPDPTFARRRASYRRLANSLLGVEQGKPEHPCAQSVLEDLLIALAHLEVGNDVLITCSPFILERRDDNLFHQANPLRPSEAIYLVGLLLRSRGDYTFMGRGGSWVSLDRNDFYRSLVNWLLPDLAPSYRLCLSLDATSNWRSKTSGMAGSVSLRTIRALQALDEINVQLHSIHSWDGLARWAIDRTADRHTAWDKIFYHFDYLLLLLSGALDAQARLAHRFYGVNAKTVRLQQTSFKLRPKAPNSTELSSRFLDELIAKGAATLSEEISRNEFQRLLTLITEPRNTIHEVALSYIQTEAHASTSQGNKIVFRLSAQEDVAEKMRSAAAELGGQDLWGLSDGGDGELQIEPCTYANALVAKALPAINRVAKATEADVPGRHLRASAVENHSDASKPGLDQPILLLGRSPYPYGIT